eukprot:PhM_4_TR689/c0_g1_i1/m.41133
MERRILVCKPRTESERQFVESWICTNWPMRPKTDFEMADVVIAVTQPEGEIIGCEVLITGTFSGEDYGIPKTSVPYKTRTLRHDDLTFSGLVLVKPEKRFLKIGHLMTTIQSLQGVVKFGPKSILLTTSHKGSRKLATDHNISVVPGLSFFKKETPDVESYVCVGSALEVAKRGLQHWEETHSRYCDMGNDVKDIADKCRRLCDGDVVSKL